MAMSTDEINAAKKESMDSALSGIASAVYGRYVRQHIYSLGYHVKTDLDAAVGTAVKTATQDAKDAADRAETAQGKAEEAASTVETEAAQIQTNTESVKVLDEFVDRTFDAAESVNVFDGVWNVGRMLPNGTVDCLDADTYHRYYTNKIPTNGNTSLTLTCTNTVDGYRYNFIAEYITVFDADGKADSQKAKAKAGTSGSLAGEGLTVIDDIDSSAAYIVVTYYNGITHPDVMISFDTTVKEYHEYGTTYTLKPEGMPPDVKAAEIADYLSGKTVAVFGDSIMFGAGNQHGSVYDGPGEILAEKYGMTCEKYAISGAVMGEYTDEEGKVKSHIADQIRLAVTAGISPDLIIFNGGTNDCLSQHTALGTVSKVYTAPKSEDGFSSGFETAAYLLKTSFRHVPMLYIRAHNMSSRAYDDQKNYGEQGVAIAEKWGIDVLDMYKKMNTQLEADETEYLYDSTHPNEAGYETFYIPGIENWVYDLIGLVNSADE